MLYQKQECNGALYQMCLYSMGTMPGMSPRQRAGRRRTTEKAKQEINRRQRKWRLMQLINANFVSGRDLFVCLTYAPEASRARALEKFHAKMKKEYAKIVLTYKYIAVTEEHDMDGEPVRLHHHLILSGAADVRLAELVRECWPNGLADVRTLREGADFFEDTAIYLLKEDCHKGKGARRYSTSRNLTPPAEPVRLRLGEEEEAEVPPGVKIIEHVQNANEFGRYEVMVGRIYNQAAFSAWWSAQRRKAAPDPWERLRRRRQRKV